MTQPSKTDSPSISSPEGPPVDTNRSAPDSSSPRSRKHSTKLACIFCRKKRTKCDGHVPCGSCRTHQQDCVYEKSGQRTKSSLRDELDLLKKSLHTSETIIDALRHSRHPNRIVEQLQGGATNDQIAEMLNDLAAEPQQQGQSVGGHRQTIGGMPLGGTGVMTTPIDPWSDTGEERLADYSRANTTTNFWNPLFAWPPDNGVLLPFDPDADTSAGQGTGPAAGSFPGAPGV